MRLLLDTHALLWTLQTPARLSPAASAAILDKQNKVFVSIVNGWEIAIKAALGKLAVPDEIEAQIMDACGESGFELLPVELHHAFEVRNLPLHHRDPFDRLLIAQARKERLILVSSDEILGRYDVDILW